MDLTQFQQKMKEMLPDLELYMNEPLSKHTSFRIGGPVEVLSFPQSSRQLSEILKVSALLDCKPRILGAGTNILAPDDGLPGLVICLKDGIGGMERIDQTHICVGAGVSMARAAVFAASCGLTGLEFAHGIPGSVGGGVYMNAGAYGSELCQVVQWVDVMDLSGNIRRLTNEEMRFSYRHSILEEEYGIVIRVQFALNVGREEDIRGYMQELMQKRRASQPLDKPSAGSAFKRPVGGYAAALIDSAGLKGYQVGGAAVSQKHAGFVVNLGGATEKDVKQVLLDVANKVFENFGIRLEPEVRIW